MLCEKGLNTSTTHVSPGQSLQSAQSYMVHNLLLFKFSAYPSTSLPPASVSHETKWILWIPNSFSPARWCDKHTIYLVWECWVQLNSVLFVDQITFNI